MTNKKRLVAVVMAAIIFIVVMASLLVVAHEADHDCIGENCPICTVIALCQNTLKMLSGVTVAIVAILAYFCFKAVCSVFSCIALYNGNENVTSLIILIFLPGNILLPSNFTTLILAVCIYSDGSFAKSKKQSYVKIA